MESCSVPENSDLKYKKKSLKPEVKISTSIGEAEILFFKILSQW
jgi:hypothetical protein